MQFLDMRLQDTALQREKSLEKLLGLLQKINLWILLQPLITEYLPMK